MILDFVTGALPETVSIDNIEYPIRSDFRVGFKFDSIMRSRKPAEQVLSEMLILYYPQIPTNIQEAVNKVLWFYHCGDIRTEKREGDTKERYKGKKQNSAPYALSQDAAYIFSAFKEQYGIDLTEIETMHWWKFMALFESLGEDTKMSKIMYYRTVRTTGLPKERRAFINDMKKLYKIQDSAIGMQEMTLEMRNKQWKDYIKSRHDKLIMG